MDGDAACDSNDSRALVGLCERIAALDASFERPAGDVARWASDDMSVASVHWSDLALLLRRWESQLDGIGQEAV